MAGKSANQLSLLNNTISSTLIFSIISVNRVLKKSMSSFLEALPRFTIISLKGSFLRIKLSKKSLSLVIRILCSATIAD